MLNPFHSLIIKAVHKVTVNDKARAANFKYAETNLRI